MQREIFEYHDGQRRHFGDPVAIERLLIDYLGGDPAGAHRATKSEVPEIKSQAIERVKIASCAAFKLPPWDDSQEDPALRGTPEDVLLDTFNQFFAWRQKKNQSTGSSPTLPPSTDSPARSNASPYNQATSSVTGSGST